MDSEHLLKVNIRFRNVYGNYSVGVRRSLVVLVDTNLTYYQDKSNPEVPVPISYQVEKALSSVSYAPSLSGTMKDKNPLHYVPEVESVFLIDYVLDELDVNCLYNFYSRTYYFLEDVVKRCSTLVYQPDPLSRMTSESELLGN